MKECSEECVDVSKNESTTPTKYKALQLQLYFSQVEALPGNANELTLPTSERMSTG